MDIPDLLEVVHLAFAGLAPSEKLWDQSPQTFRTRFKQLLVALKLPVQKTQGLKPLDPGSLRPGGATWILQTTESGELLLRRGRWASHRVMSIYVQEVSAMIYMKKIEKQSAEWVLAWAHQFPYVLTKVQFLSNLGIDKANWFHLI